MLIELLITLIGALLSVAFLTVSERNVMASIQRRRGPNIVGAYGLLQAIADGVKLIFKDIIIPIRANPVLFMLPALLFYICPIFGAHGLTNKNNKCRYVKPSKKWLNAPFGLIRPTGLVVEIARVGSVYRARIISGHKRSITVRWFVAIWILMCLAWLGRIF